MAKRKNSDDDINRGKPYPLLAKAGWTRRRRRLEYGGDYED